MKRPRLHVVGGSDLTDLQRQIEDRRAELQRAWTYQQAGDAPTPADAPLAKDWNDLQSRAWDFVHETQSYLDAAGQDDRGRKLLQELEAMRTRFEAGGIGKAALDVTPPPPAPSLDPSHTTPSLASFFAGLPSNVETLLLIAAVAWLATRKR